MDITTLPSELTLTVDQAVEIKSTPDKAFAAMLSQLSDRFEIPSGDKMPMKLEARPGGRWYRDLGKDEGHLWGHVQVIKRPKLVEITGPLFMSYPALSHLQLRITPTDNGCKLTLRHLALGMIDDDHRQGVNEGWSHFLKGVRSHAEH